MVKESGDNFEDLQSFCDVFIPHKRIVLAISGGADSLALMYLAYEWALKRKRVDDFLVLSVDHGLREESALEVDLVLRLAKEIGFAAKGLTWHPPEDLSTGIQEKAAQARYELMSEEAKKFGADVLVLAHHRDDQVETFLMRLAKGSGIEGLVGMQEASKRYGITLLRPFLTVSKDQLSGFLQKTHSKLWVEDPSNEDERFERVKWRKRRELIAEWGLNYDHLSLSMHRLDRANEALSNLTKNWYETHVKIADLGYVSLPWSAFEKLPEELQLRVLQLGVRQVRRHHIVSLAKREALLKTLKENKKHDVMTMGGVLFKRQQKRNIKGNEQEADGQLLLLPEAGRSDKVTYPLKPHDKFLWDQRALVEIDEHWPQTDAGQEYHLGLVGIVHYRKLVSDKLIKPLVHSDVGASLAGIYQNENLIMVPQLDLDLRADQSLKTAPKLDQIKISFSPLFE